MPFKIVKSIENGGSVLEIVPDLWEKNGVCWWPKNDLSKKHRDEKCKVDATFYSLPCQVKRNNIETFAMVSQILDIMRNKSSTDDSDHDESNTKTIQFRRGPNTVNKMNILPDMTKVITPSVSMSDCFLK